MYRNCLIPGKTLIYYRSLNWLVLAQQTTWKTLLAEQGLFQLQAIVSFFCVNVSIQVLQIVQVEYIQHLLFQSSRRT